MDQSKNYPFCLTKKEEMFKWARCSMFGMTATVAKKRTEEMVDYEQLLNSGKNNDKTAVVGLHGNYTFFHLEHSVIKIR